MRKVYIGVTLILIFFVSFILLKTAVKIQPDSTKTLHYLFSSLAILGIGSAICMWGWMLIDLIKRKNLKFKLAWAVILLLIYFPGAIIYFVIVVMPAEKRRCAVVSNS